MGPKYPVRVHSLVIELYHERVKKTGPSRGRFRLNRLKRLANDLERHRLQRAFGFYLNQVESAGPLTDVEHEL